MQGGDHDGSDHRGRFIAFDRVRKTYDGRSDAVRDLSLEVRKGEFLTLLGPSGSGKTTTLMMLAGFERPTSGDILMQGRSLLRVPPFRRGIGIVFQSYALFPHMDVGANVDFPLSVRGIQSSERKRRVRRALEMVQMERFADRRPAQLSGGQQQRVALARALVFEPALVLLDEPLGALDKRLREEMQIELRQLHARLGVTMVYVTHDQDEALVLSDRIAVFHDGTLRQVAAPRTLYDDPDDAFIATFIGENNALRGTVRRVDADGVAEIALLCGPVVEAQTTSTLRAGQPCLCCVRPERVAVAAAEAAEMGERAISAVLTEALYLGDHMRLRFAVGEGGEITVKRPAAAGMAGLAPGRGAALAWEPGHARAFADM